MTVKVSKSAINLREKLAKVDKPTGIAGEAMLRAETPQEQFNLIGAGRRRINQNGDMRIAQRGTSSTSTGYLVDRYKVDNITTATFTQSQGTASPPENFGYYFKINTDTADTSIDSGLYSHFVHSVEGQDIIGSGWGTSSAIPITLSFWVKSNVTGTYAVEIQSGVGSYESSHNYTIEASGVWEHKTVTFPPFTLTALPIDNTAGFYINWWLAAGSTWNTGNISPEWTTGDSGRASGQVNLFAAVNNYWQITGIQLELGKVATPFEYRSYGEELALCERYFQSMNGTIHAHPCWTYSTNNASTTFYPRTRMRTTPTFTRNGSLETGSVSTGFSYYQAGAWLGLSALTFDTGGSSQDGFRIDLTTDTAHNDSGGAGGLYIGTAASFHFDAEI